MARQGGKKDVDAQVDLHGMTAEEMRLTLERRWPQWKGMRGVRVITGQGVVLGPELQTWCAERGIPCRVESVNPGSYLLSPLQRRVDDATLTTSLRDRLNGLPAELQAILKDPAAAERERMALELRRREEERKRREDEARRERERRDAESLWMAEVARLDKIEKKRGKAVPQGDVKPVAPKVVPPSVMKYQDGYWRAELVRVAETEEETLKKEKRTGLEKLAPPLPARKDDPAAVSKAQPPAKPPKPVRDDAAELALFEEEMSRLSNTDASTLRRDKRADY